MQHWMKCILVFAWKMVILVGAQCPPGFNCSDQTSCYLIYPGSNGLEYQDPDGTTWSFDDTRVVYPSPNCYKYIPMNGAKQSCTDTQRECEKLGGNITVINSIEEEDALTGLVHHIMLTGFDIKFKVFNQEVDLGINKGCATFTIHNYISEYKLFMANTNCFSAHQIDAIICESSDVNIAKICPKPRRPPIDEEDPPTISIKTTAILVSAILTILLSCFLGCIRSKQRTTNLGNGTHVVRYQVAAEDVRGTELHTTAAFAQNYDPISAAYEYNTGYHDSTVKVAYDDTAAAKARSGLP